MPAGAVQEHQDLFAGVAVGHLAQEQAHGFGMDFRQDQGHHGAVERADGRVHVGVFPHRLGRHVRPDPRRGPAAAGVGDPAEAGFILEKEAPGRRPHRLHPIG